VPPDRAAVRRPRVGHIDFLNCLPIYWGLVHTGALLDVDLTKDTPDRLNDALIRGDLDVGPISVVPYLEHADELVLLPDLAVGSDGPVLSCVLVSTRPLTELDRGHVALGSTSRTSVLLARMLLEDSVGVRPTYRSMPPDLGVMLREADAAVLIGDPALRATHDARERGLHLLDLGDAWKRWSGLPMVFAVWAARREWVDSHADQAAAVHDAFLRSRARALTELDQVAEHAAAYEELPAVALATYFRTLDFSLGPRQLAGLREFARRAALRGAAPAHPDIRLLAAGEALRTPA
jgi:chorismate dehydratase